MNDNKIPAGLIRAVQIIKDAMDGAPPRCKPPIAISYWDILEATGITEYDKNKGFFPGERAPNIYKINQN